jgi:hypothetical protein
MATISVLGDRLRVEFPRKEKLLGLVGDFDAPLSAVTEAHEVRGWRDDLRGMRVGLGLPGDWLLGRWMSRGHRQLVALRRERPAVYVALSGQKYDALLIETPDPGLLLAQLGR